jgi:uncharacterized alpha-E superfamily protein
MAKYKAITAARRNRRAVSRRTVLSYVVFAECNPRSGLHRLSGVGEHLAILVSCIERNPADAVETCH